MGELSAKYVECSHSILPFRLIYLKYYWACRAHYIQSKHTEKCIVPLTCIHVTGNWSSFWKIANMNILLDIQEYMLIQHKHTLTYSCKHGNHVRWTRNKSKEYSFWRLPALLLCVKLQGDKDEPTVRLVRFQWIIWELVVECWPTSHI